MMKPSNVRPTSIWKRQWGGPSARFVWVILTAATGFGCVFAVCFAANLHTKEALELSIAGATAVALAAAFSAVVAAARWLCRRWRRVLLAIVCVSSLFVLFYVEEDMKGASSWHRFKREQEAKGDNFDWSAFVPSPVPDDQNFAMTPLLRVIFDYTQSSNQIQWRDINQFCSARFLRWG